MIFISKFISNKSPLSIIVGQLFLISIYDDTSLIIWFYSACQIFQTIL
jgi:hypothetical protein